MVPVKVVMPSESTDEMLRGFAVSSSLARSISCHEAVEFARRSLVWSGEMVAKVVPVRS